MNIKAGLIVCDGVPPAGRGNNQGMQQQQSLPETPFDVAFDYFHIISKGLK